MKHNLTLATLLAASFLLISSCASKKELQNEATVDAPQELITVGFYNLENLFDTDDDPENEGDQEWLPTSEKRWTAKRYQEKLGRMASAIADIGAETFQGGPALLGVCEVENAKVLYDLIAQPALLNSNYEVIHYESPDYRGIDCALLYRKDFFEPSESEPLTVIPGYRDGKARVTRDILWVSGKLLGNQIYYAVNHWPSRRGGETASRPGRDSAATVLRKKVVEVRSLDQDAEIIIVGDFNDDPVSPSIAKTLQSTGKRSDVGQTGLYNPMVSLYRQGVGSLGYRDSWNLFDQIIVSQGLADRNGGWTFRNAKVFRKKYMLQQGGRYRNYPLRTFVGSNYMGGYSDHLPVYAVLSRPEG